MKTFKTPLRIVASNTPEQVELARRCAAEGHPAFRAGLDRCECGRLYLRA